VAGNAIAVTVTTAQLFGHYAKQTTSADADSFEQSFLLKAGTYTVHFHGQTTAASAIIDWAIDGTQIKAGQDWYAAGPATANVDKTVASVVIAETDRHVLTGTVNDNHASSGGFDIRLTKIWFEPASDIA
jgi:hypothetical protein